MQATKTHAVKATNPGMGCRSDVSFIARRSVCALLAFAGIAAQVPPAAAGDLGQPLAATPQAGTDEKLQFGLDIYGWAPGMDLSLSNGQQVKIGFDKILDDLKMTAMFGFGVRKGRWWAGTDVIYLQLATNAGRVGERAAVSDDINMKAWILNPVGGYTALTGPKGRLDVFGGARYIHIGLSQDLRAAGPSGAVGVSTRDSEGVWAGIVGIRGELKLSEKWYLPFYGDFGTGKPNLTWQTFGGIGYRLSKCDLVLGYRYINWDVGESGAVRSLAVKGPILGLKFVF